MNIEQPLIFLSYTVKDRDRVIDFYQYLIEENFSVWMDFKAIKTGQNWDFELKKALGRASIIIIFVSENSISKRGYVQREIKIALDRYSEKLVDDVYIIPVLLDDDVEFPYELKGVQFTKASSDNCKSDIKDAISTQLQRLNIATVETQQKSHLRWTFEKYNDEWDGLPGYRTEIDFLKLNSKEFSRVNEISDVIRGKLLQEAAHSRYAKFSMDVDLYNYGQEKERRTNYLEAQCGEPTVQGKIFSVIYTIHSYYSGAAHPNTNYMSFCFILDPVIPIISFEQLFANPDIAFQIIQTEVRAQLLKKQSAPEQSNIEHNKSDESDTYELDTDWVNRGTSNWSDLSCFIFRQDVIEIIFPEYQVDCYASGPHSVRISLKQVAGLMKKFFVSALNIEHVLTDYNDK